MCTKVCKPLVALGLKSAYVSKRNYQTFWEVHFLTLEDWDHSHLSAADTNQQLLQLSLSLTQDRTAGMTLSKGNKIEQLPSSLINMLHHVCLTSQWTKESPRQGIIEITTKPQDRTWRCRSCNLWTHPLLPVFVIKSANRLWLHSCRRDAAFSQNVIRCYSSWWTWAVLCSYGRRFLWGGSQLVFRSLCSSAASTTGTL